MKTLRIIAAAAALSAAAACTHPVDTADAPTFGASVEAMQRAQIIESTPEAGAPEGSGATGALAQDRYKRGETRPLLPSATSISNAGQ